jgi:hypothetical protein
VTERPVVKNSLPIADQDDGAGYPSAVNLPLDDPFDCLAVNYVGARSGCSR